ncbi:OpgC domain-containing protein [Blastopirellula sp. J2-11]|uniref:OpgC family protein n=1 Tax=Blastopirellula sp. J2-11 TaxID=2943192 RepID=UPI0021C7BBE5|nr:OpgC domain-containing protein [Blastopirellula sp. J2-11]UUO04985.1 OpgC domain-containing protein [Blastopirellula sp. J2-11]
MNLSSTYPSQKLSLTPSEDPNGDIGVAHPPQVGTRRLELDFLRGVALLVVLVDHIEARGGVKLISAWTPISLGFSDGAEAFVFLSGVVFGLVGFRRLERNGFLFVQKSALWRALLIYVTFLFATWAVLLVAMLFGASSASLTRLIDLGDGVLLPWLWSFTLCFQPYCLEILAFYVVLMPFATVLLWLYDRYWQLACLLSLGAYMAARNFNWVELPRFPWGDREWYFNPFAWQFVFFLGLVASRIDFKTAGSRLARFLAIIFAIAVLAWGLRVQWSTSPLPELEFLGEGIQEWLGDWREKTRPHPLRIVHFLCLAYLLAILLPGPTAKFWKSVWAAPIVKAGQHSLQVYALGVVAMYLCFPLLDAFRGNSELVLFVAMDCCLVSIGFAYFVAWIKSPRRIMPQSTI